MSRYRTGRFLTRITSAISFIVLIVSLPFAVLSVPTNAAVMQAYETNQAQAHVRWIEERAKGQRSNEWIKMPAPDLTSPGMFYLASFVAMFVCSICFCMLAIFDIADRYLAEPEKIAEEPEPEPEPGPEQEPEPEAQRPPAMPYGITDMDESTAQRIAEEDERKFKGKQ